MLVPREQLLKKARHFKRKIGNRTSFTQRLKYTSLKELFDCRCFSNGSCLHLLILNKARSAGSLKRLTLGWAQALTEHHWVWSCEDWRMEFSDRHLESDKLKKTIFSALLLSHQRAAEVWDWFKSLGEEAKLGMRHFPLDWAVSRLQAMKGIGGSF